MAGIEPNNQANIAFKNLLGKSNTDINKDLGGEAEGIFFNVSSTNVWTSVIPSNDPSSAVTNGIALLVTADFVVDTSSNNHGYFLEWPSVAP